jgi:hypothetical protein
MQRQDHRGPVTRARWGRTALVVLMLGSLIAVALPGASAGAGPTTGSTTSAAEYYPPATNYRTQYLTANPREGMATAEVKRSIYLVSGTYEWNLDIFGPPDWCWNVYNCRAVKSTTIGLVAGWYAWNCYLDPRIGTYVESCTLKTAGYPQATLSSREFSITPSGEWIWGGYLYRIGN